MAVDEGDESMHALSWCLKNVVADGAPGDTLLLLHAKPARTVYPSMDGTGEYCVVPQIPAHPAALVPGGPDGLGLGIIVSPAGYLISAEMMSTMERCSSQVADAVMARAKQACKGLRNVSTPVCRGNPRALRRFLPSQLCCAACGR